MKTALTILVISMVLSIAGPQPCMAEALPTVVALREAEEQWRAIEPELFTSDAARKYISIWVRCSGSPISLRTPITIKLASGAIVRLTKLQGADRNELATFRKPPSVVIVRGPILAIDRATRTVTIRAVSTMFEQ